MDVREKQSSGKRLIDADKLLTNAVTISNSEGQATWSAVSTIDILAAPIVDVVEIVRCWECKHRGTDDCIFHIKGEPADEELLLKLDNNFCSYGERKEGAD